MANGIDLGTTYSVVATSNNSVVRVYQDSKTAEQTVPSVAYYDSVKGGFIVGKTAKKMLATKPQETVELVKRYMEPDPRDPNWSEFKREINGVTYDAVAISAEILKHMAAIVKEADGTPAKDVVITIPAYYGLKAANWTKKAGEEAGLNVLDVVPEPTAAAIYYATQETLQNRIAVVFDLGGGTFDVSIVKIELKPDQNGNQQPHMKVLAFDGNRRLGGTDWDDLLLKVVMQKYADDQGISLADVSEKDEQKMRKEIEQLKYELSDMESSVINFTDSTGNDCEYTVTRTEFEDATAGLVLAAKNGLDQVIRKANLTDADIDCVYLVGGSTMMPMIIDPLKARFGEEKIRRKDPHLAVAMGAAIYAEDMQKYIIGESDGGDGGNGGNSGNGGNGGNIGGVGPGTIAVRSTDKAPRSFGIGVRETTSNKMMMLNLVLKDDELPVTTAPNEIPLSVPYDGCMELEIPVYENLAMAKNRLLQLPLIYDLNGNEQNDKVDYANNPDSIVYIGQIVVPTPDHAKKDDPLQVEMSISIGRVIAIKVTFSNGSVEEGTLEMPRS